MQRLAGNFQLAALHALFQGILANAQIDIGTCISFWHIDHHRQTTALCHAGIIHRGKLLEHIFALFQGQFLQLEHSDTLSGILHLQHLLRKLHHAIVLQFRQIFFIHQMVCKGQLVRQVIQRPLRGKLLRLLHFKLVCHDLFSFLLLTPQNLPYQARRSQCRTCCDGRAHVAAL